MNSNIREGLFKKSGCQGFQTFETRGVGWFVYTVMLERGPKMSPFYPGPVLRKFSKTTLCLDKA